MFRDTHVGTDGVERVLHEYTLAASVDRPTLEILECRAQPQALPWPECPDAAASARRLEGARIPDLHALAQRELHGVSTCTHLNDLLRSLANVSMLVMILEDQSP
jgi:hypothetical protein